MSIKKIAHEAGKRVWQMYDEKELEKEWIMLEKFMLKKALAFRFKQLLSLV